MEEEEEVVVVVPLRAITWPDMLTGIAAVKLAREGSAKGREK